MGNFIIFYILKKPIEEGRYTVSLEELRITNEEEAILFKIEDAQGNSIVKQKNVSAQSRCVIDISNKKYVLTRLILKHIFSVLEFFWIYIVKYGNL